METEKAIEILKEFKRTGYHTLMCKYDFDRKRMNTTIEIAIETVLEELDALKFKYQARKDRTNTKIKKQDKIIESVKDRIEYYLMGNSTLNDFNVREKELERLLKVLNKAEESE